MSRVKRKSVSSDGPPAKQGVTTKSVDKWNDKQLSMATWLCYDKADQEHVSVLKFQFFLWKLSDVRPLSGALPVLYNIVSINSLYVRNVS